MPGASSPTRAAASTRSTWGSRRGNRTGESSQAACCAAHASTTSRRTALSTGARSPRTSSLYAQSGARLRGARSPSTAGSSISSTARARRGGRTGAPSPAAFCATRAASTLGSRAPSKDAGRSRSCLLLPRGGARIPSAASLRAAVSCTRSMRGRRRGGGTGAISLAGCCVRIATRTTAHTARSTEQPRDGREARRTRGRRARRPSCCCAWGGGCRMPSRRCRRGPRTVAIMIIMGRSVGEREV
mmetsp:Transcript_3505/g.6994  ORF Transcript_3505/g.6994 Transcript_3505/m.6994 type:complete len:244 (+) Transcript_3505:579-1310(+)